MKPVEEATEVEEKEVEVSQEDEMTGEAAQDDPEFANEAKIEDDLKPEPPEMQIEEIENTLGAMDDFDSEEFKSSLADYDNFIVLPKRELAQFIRAIEPLTKASVDQYGKSIQISCLTKDTVELRYSNSPFKLVAKINNKSQKVVKTFCMQISLLKKLVVQAYANIVIVETEGTYSLAIFDSLMFLETLNLKEDEFKLDREVLTNNLDKDLGLFNFRKLGAVLDFSDRTSEKVIVVKGNECFYNIGVFSACVKSPFIETIDLLLFKSTVDLLGILMEISKVDIRYKIYPTKLVVECDGLIYCEMPISEKIEDHFSPNIAKNLKFKADVEIVNDSMSRIFNFVKSLDYLSDIVEIGFSKISMSLEVFSNNLTRSSKYDFPINSGNPTSEGRMKVSASVMKPYLDVTGSNVKYDFNEIGLCMQNDNGSYIVRRNN